MKHRDTRRKTQVLIASVLMALMLVSCGGNGAPDVDWEISISGAVDTPLTLTYADLAEMPQTELNEILMEKSTGEDEVTTWSGVSLDVIFEQAGVDEAFSTVIATAADGYAIEITRDELEGGIIALRDFEGWIAETDPDKGPIRLVTPQTPGNRWVFSLTALTVQP
ncbi:MAG: molybdopterin-dependent oxidoreductase [Anaerolineales bacterium]|nr:molybdopterin-dependent oxidoreductase [Anaerolineales bacterium]